MYQTKCVEGLIWSDLMSHYNPLELFADGITYVLIGMAGAILDVDLYQKEPWSVYRDKVTIVEDIYGT